MPKFLCFYEQIFFQRYCVSCYIHDNHHLTALFQDSLDELVAEMIKRLKPALTALWIQFVLSFSHMLCIINLRSSHDSVVKSLDLTKDQFQLAPVSVIGGTRKGIGPKLLPCTGIVPLCSWAGNNQTTRYILPRHWLYEWFSQPFYRPSSRPHTDTTYTICWLLLAGEEQWNGCNKAVQLWWADAAESNVWRAGAQ